VERLARLGPGQLKAEGGSIRNCPDGRPCSDPPIGLKAFLDLAGSYAGDLLDVSLSDGVRHPIHEDNEAIRFSPGAEIDVGERIALLYARFSFNFFPSAGEDE